VLFIVNRIDTEGVIKRVKKIFKGHRDLILGFNQFLPRGHEIRVEDIEKEEREEAKRQAQGQKPQVEFVHAISYVNKIKTRFASDERVYKTFLEILNMYRKNLKSISQVYEEVAQLFKSHNDLLEQFTYFLPDSTQQAGQGATGRGRGGRGAGAKAARAQQAPGQNRRKQKGGVVYDQAQQDEITEEKRAALQLAKELSYFDKVKARLRSKDQYADFCKLIALFNADLISKMELQGLVMDVIGRFPELVTGWNEFVARCESMDFEAAEAPAAKKAAGMKLTTREVVKMKASAAREKFLSKPISELDLSTCERCGPSYRLLPKNFPKMHASTRTPLCKEVLNDNWVAVTSGSEDYSFKAMRKNQYEEALFRCEDDRMEIDMVLETNKSAIESLEKVHKEIAEMYTEEVKVVQEPAAPSVKKEEDTAAATTAAAASAKPTDGAPAATGEAPAPAEGAEGAAKEEKKDNMEVDAEKPAEAAAEEKPAAAPVKKSKEEVQSERLAHNLPEGTISPVALRAVERIYGDRGREMRFLTMNAPWATIPVVVRRLKQKSEEWQMLKTEMLPTWNDVCAKNYNKSLDHRSFYFKQADKKNLSGKGMTQEIKEVSDKKKTADDAIGPRAAKPPGASPDLIFEYADRNVHDDVYAIARFSAREMMSGEPANKVMTFYRDFVEPFFKIKRDNEDDFKDRTADNCAKAVKAAEANASPGGKKKGKKGGSKDPKKKASEEEDAEEEKDEEMEKEPDQETVDEGAEEEEEDPEDEGVASVKKRAATPKASNKETTAAEALEKALGLTGNDDDDDDKTKDSSESDGDENDSSDSEDDQDARYKSCKPVSGFVVDGSSNSKTRYFELPGKVFYGDEGFYHLMRLHQHLYDRLQTARASATAMAKKAKGKKAEDVHKEFLTLLFNLLNGSTDQSHFEDDCRLLLGANSYLLFTLDKLVYKLIKQVQALLAEDIDSKLLHLAEYESTRDAPFHEGVYHANACVILGDESVYRIGSENNGKTLQIQLCEPSLDKIDVKAGAMDGHFATHLEGFLHVAAHEDTTIVETGDKETDEKERAPVFLRRAKKSAGFVVHSASGETDSQLSYQTAMTNASIQNALECKISCSTSKVSYVLDTEDVFFRSRVPPGGYSAKSVAPPAKKAKKGSSKDKAVAVPQPAARPLSRKEKLKAKSAKSKAQIEKFRAWIEKKTAEATDDEEEDKKKDAKVEEKKETAEEKKDGDEAEPMDAA